MTPISVLLKEDSLSTIEDLCLRCGATGAHALRLPGHPNVVLWHEGSAEMCMELMRMLRTKEVRLLPTSPSDYCARPPLPLYRKDYKGECWLPVLVTLANTGSRRVERLRVGA